MSQTSLADADTPQADPVWGAAGVITQTLRDRETLLERIYTGRDLASVLVTQIGMNLTLLAAYGLILGMGSGWLQALSSGMKLPLLYLLSLAVCFPVLFVVNVLMGSRLGLRQTFSLILVALSLNSLLLGACAPIALFFQVTGSDYHFLKLMHVGILGFAGFWAMGGLYRALVHMCESSSVYPRMALRILLLWILVFGLVGAQMAWRLRPFLGAPDLQFEWVRSEGKGNFYQAVWQAVENLD